MSALLLVSACSRTGKLTIVLDSNSSPEGLEVLLVPADPAQLLRGTSPSATAGQADSLATLAVLEDSTAALDEEFLRQRDQLNSEASALARNDRRSNEYAERYDEFRPRAARAESLRSARDKLSARAVAYRAALTALLPDSARIRARSEESRRKLNAARADGRATRSQAATAKPLTLQLKPGRWWVGVAKDGLAPLAFQEITLRENGADTLRLRLKSR